MFILKQSHDSHIQLQHNITPEQNPKPRSIFWILFPIMLGPLGSLILHYNLKIDKKNNRGIIVGLNKFNWVMAAIWVAMLYVTYYDYWTFELFAAAHGCYLDEKSMICVLQE